jgi:hypothetical protein
MPFDGGRMTLSRLTELTRVVAEAPEELLHLQNAGLTRAGSEQAIEVLAHLQRAWMDLSERLDCLLYLDTLPGEGELTQAIHRSGKETRGTDAFKGAGGQRLQPIRAYSAPNNGSAPKIGLRNLRRSRSSCS